MSSYWAEAQGAADAIHTSQAEAIQGAHRYLDNKGVVQRLQQTRPIHSLKSEWELLEPTRKRLRESQVTVNHVKGYQNLALPNISREAHLNHQADCLTNTAHTEAQNYGNQPPGYGVILYIHSKPVTEEDESAIHHAATTPGNMPVLKEKKWMDRGSDGYYWVEGIWESSEGFYYQAREKNPQIRLQLAPHPGGPG